MIAINAERAKTYRNFRTYPEPEQRLHYWALYTSRKIAQVYKGIGDLLTIIEEIREVVKVIKKRDTRSGGTNA